MKEEGRRRRLRILYYVEGLDIGGANQSTLTTALAMKARGHEVFHASKDGPLRSLLDEGKIPHIGVETRVVHPSRKVASQLGEILDEERINLVCPNGWDCMMDALLAAIPRGLPVVPTFPGIYPDYRHPRLPRAIVYSGEYREALIRRYGWNPASLEIFVNRIDTRRFRPGLDGGGFRARWAVPGDAQVVLMACRLDSLKIEGIRFLLDAIPVLARRNPAARILLVGDGKHRGEVEERIHALNAELGFPAAAATGKVLAMEEAFSAADIVVGNGARSALEGFACGKPVVSVGPAGIAGVFSPENIEDFAFYNFDKGRVFDGSSVRAPEVLAETLDSLLKDDERRRLLAEFGREYSVRKLGIEVGMDRLEAIYSQARRRKFLERLWDRSEFLRSYVSFTAFRARWKLRRMLFGSGGPGPPGSGTGARKEPGFLRNSATTFLTGMFGLGVGMVQAVVVARVLKPEGKGALISALLLPQLLVTLAPLGINWASTYHLGRRTFDRETLIRTCISALMVLGGASMVICLGAGLLLRDSILTGVPLAAFLLGVFTVPTSIAVALLNGVFRGEMRITESNRMMASRTTLMFLCILAALLVLRLGVVGVVLAQLFAEAMVIAVSFVRLGGVRPAPLFRWDVLRSLTAYGLQVYSFSILLYLNYRFDLFLVRSKLDLVQTGLYSTAVSLAEILWMVPTSLGVVLFPSVARSEGEERDRLALAVCRNSFWIMLILCAALALGRSVALRVLFGAQFVPAAPALLAILPGILAMSVQLVLGSALSGRGRPLPVTLGAGAGLVVNVVLNLLWIPRYGIVGASLASSVSYSLVALMVVVAFLRISKSRVRDAFLLRRDDWRRFAGLLGRLKEAFA